MFNFKYQDLGKITILCTLHLSSVALAEGPLDLEGENLIGPKSFSIIKRPKYNWEEKKPQGQIHRENSSQAYSAEKSEGYIATHNRMATKYGCTQRIIHPRAPYEGLTLVSSAKIFKEEAEKLKEIQEADLKKTNAFGKSLLSGGSAIAEIAIDETVKDKSAKNVLIQLKDDLTDYLKMFFN